MKHSLGIAAALSALSLGFANATTVVLYDQDFESPAAYSNDGGDVNIFDTINDSYSTSDFTFAQTFTVEILNVSGSARGGGTAAFGTGYSDPSGDGGDFAIGMLSDTQNDLLGLAFDVGSKDFLNVSLDISSIDLSVFGGPFAATTPTFRLTLFDNPGGLPAVSGGAVLSSMDITGTSSAQDVFDWSNFVVGLSTAGNTNGNVLLQIDLLTGNYAAFDNLRIAASDDEGDVGVVPLPAAAWMFLAGLGFLGRKKLRR